MASVTQRAKEVKQPYGGYLPMKSFKKEIFNDGASLHEDENIHASLIGMAVDYLTRFMLGDPADKAFHISYLGASNIGMQEKANFLMSKISGLDDVSIVAACKLAGFDVCYRATKTAYRPVEEIEPDAQTIKNIETMVKRSIAFLKKYGPIVCSEPTFEGGYSQIVNTGDGDFLSKDTLWDFKVLKSTPNTKHTLQILMYYIMGQHSVHQHFKNIAYLGFFNPRHNIAYTCPISSISKETIAIVETEVLGYNGATNETQSQHEAKQASTRDITVAELCEVAGLKKSEVYAHIRSGKLNAYKKGNKYCISYDDCVDYLERIKTERRILIGIAIVAPIIALILAFLFTYNLLPT